MFGVELKRYIHCARASLTKIKQCDAYLPRVALAFGAVLMRYPVIDPATIVARPAV